MVLQLALLLRQQLPGFSFVKSNFAFPVAKLFLFLGKLPFPLRQRLIFSFEKLFPLGMAFLQTL